MSRTGQGRAARKSVQLAFRVEPELISLIREVAELESSRLGDRVPEASVVRAAIRIGLGAMRSEYRDVKRRGGSIP